MTTIPPVTNREDLETELAHALGALAIQFGRLEHSVAELVGAAFGRMDIASCEAINSVVSFRQKLDIVGALAPSRITDGESLLEVQQCIKQAGLFEERRNSLLHAFWAYEPATPSSTERGLLQSRTKAHRTKGLVTSRSAAKPSDIQQLAKEIEHFRRVFGGSGSLYHAASLLYESTIRKP